MNFRGIPAFYVLPVVNTLHKVNVILFLFAIFSFSLHTNYCRITLFRCFCFLFIWLNICQFRDICRTITLLPHIRIFVLWKKKNQVKRLSWPNGTDNVNAPNSRNFSFSFSLVVCWIRLPASVYALFARKHFSSIL